MDSQQLSEETIIDKATRLEISGSSEHQIINKSAPFYRVPGVASSQWLTLQSLLSKPRRLTPFTVNASFDNWIYYLNAESASFATLYSELFQMLLHPRFNIRLTLHIPGHQFAVLKLGIAYCPTLYNSDVPSVFAYGHPKGLLPIPAGNNPVAKYNFITTLNGRFFELCNSSQVITIDSNIPINYPFNPKAASATLVHIPSFGGFVLNSISTPRFGMDLTSVSVTPFLQLIDLEAPTWRS